MYAWEQIQQTVDYIDKHLGEELAIDNLAEMASLSPFYYQRLFKMCIRDSSRDRGKGRKSCIFPAGGDTLAVECGISCALYRSAVSVSYTHLPVRHQGGAERGGCNGRRPADDENGHDGFPVDLHCGGFPALPEKV